MGSGGMAERRWTARTPLELDVDVEPEGGGAPQTGWRTRDVSLGGAFVAAPVGVVPGLRPQQVVDLVFRLGGPGPSRHRVRARVARVTPEGVGAAFTDFDAATFRALQEILLRRGPSGTHTRTGT